MYYWKHGRYDEAERAFRKVVELVPDNVRGLANLGALLNAQGRPDEAVGHLQHAMSVRPTYAAASNLALVEFDRGRYAEAARAYEQALALDDRDYRVWRNLALSRYWAPGERPRAEEAFARAARLARERLAVDPSDASVLADLADCDAYLGEREREPEGDRPRARPRSHRRRGPGDRRRGAGAPGRPGGGPRDTGPRDGRRLSARARRARPGPRRAARRSALREADAGARPTSTRAERGGS